MTIGTALFLALGLLIICSFAFLLVVYFKEYNREEKAIQKVLEQQEKYAGLAANAPVYILDVPVSTKKTKAAPSDGFVAPADKNKKNVN